MFCLSAAAMPCPAAVGTVSTRPCPHHLVPAGLRPPPRQPERTGQAQRPPLTAACVKPGVTEGAPFPPRKLARGDPSLRQRRMLWGPRPPGRTLHTLGGIQLRQIN